MGRKCVVHPWLRLHWPGRLNHFYSQKVILTRAVWRARNMIPASFWRAEQQCSCGWTIWTINLFKSGDLTVTPTQSALTLRCTLVKQLPHVPSRTALKCISSARISQLLSHSLIPPSSYWQRSLSLSVKQHQLRSLFPPSPSHSLFCTFLLSLTSPFFPLKKTKSNGPIAFNCCGFYVVCWEVIATQHFCPQDRCCRCLSWEPVAARERTQRLEEVQGK